MCVSMCVPICLCVHVCPHVCVCPCVSPCVCVSMWHVQTLRAALDMADLKSVEIVAADGKFEDIALDISSDPALNKAVSILG